MQRVFGIVTVVILLVACGQSKKNDLGLTPTELLKGYALVSESSVNTETGWNEIKWGNDRVTWKDSSGNVTRTTFMTFGENDVSYAKQRLWLENLFQPDEVKTLGQNIVACMKGQKGTDEWVIRDRKVSCITTGSTLIVGVEPTEPTAK